MPNFARLFLILAMIAGHTASASVPPPMLHYTYVAGIDCMLSASKTEATRERFSNSDVWAPSADGTGFHHQQLPIAIRFPTDNDGMNRICIVEAEMSSADEQAALVKAFKRALGRSIRQSDSSMWLKKTSAGTRGLQFFPDSRSKQPKVRLIGAAF